MKLIFYNERTIIINLSFKFGVGISLERALIFFGFGLITQHSLTEEIYTDTCKNLRA